ncbi:heme ABC transporter ATP-binding protein [Jiella sonneratiae]|uniref:heme ABC transporter ATP-binding protein n=1 Tax=Jiella sonneratiae TaxID=2816856 RepID=UPI00315A66AB
MTLDRVEVVLGARRILGPLSLSLLPGSLTVVVGPNGAGKSTLVRAISGERPATGGSVRHDGADVAAMPAARLAGLRAVLPQASTVAFPFTVYEIVSLGLRMRAGLSPAGRRRAVAAALAAVDLEDFGARLYPELSGGEQQRVQLARVLCQVGDAVGEAGPKLLILDEPTASLDVRHQLDVLSIAKDFAEAGGVALAVLHDLNLAAGFADRMLVLDRGRLAADDAPDRVLSSGVLTQVFGVAMTVLSPQGWPRPAILPDLSACRSAPRG